MLRLFEAAYGSGLGARVDLDRIPKGRSDGVLFGEFIGSVLLEVPPACDLKTMFGNVPHFVLGEVIDASKLVLARQGETVWQESVMSLAEAWSGAFVEVVK